jgi:hypothetical protein
MAHQRFHHASAATSCNVRQYVSNYLFRLDWGSTKGDRSSPIRFVAAVGGFLPSLLTFVAMATPRPFLLNLSRCRVCVPPHKPASTGLPLQSTMDIRNVLTAAKVFVSGAC